MDYGFLVLKEPGGKNYRIIGATANTPRGLVTQNFPVAKGLIGWVLQNPKNLLIMRMNSATSDHYLFSQGETCPTRARCGECAGRPLLGYELAMVFLSRQPVEWNTDSEHAVGYAFHFLLLLLEQIYCKEENEALQPTICPRVFSAPRPSKRGWRASFTLRCSQTPPSPWGSSSSNPGRYLTTKVQPQRIRQLAARTGRLGLRCLAPRGFWSGRLLKTGSASFLPKRRSMRPKASWPNWPTMERSPARD